MFATAPLAANADANWLLGTTAQVSGTLVAIIGGFLISRVLGLVAEQRSLEFRAADLRARAGVLRAEHEKLEADLLQSDWLRWFEKAAPAVASVRGQVEIEEILEALPCEDRTADELRELFEEARLKVAEAVSELETWFTPDAPPPPDLEEIVDLASMPDVQRIAAWGAYVFLTNEFAETERERGSMFLTIPFSAPEPPAREEMIESRNLRRIKEDTAAALQADHRLVEEQAREAEVSAASINPHEGARAPAAILIYLALSGVVLPLLLMARLRVDLPASWAWTVFIAFAIGLLAMLGAIWRSLLKPGHTKDHRRKADDDPTPPRPPTSAL